MKKTDYFLRSLVVTAPLFFGACFPEQMAKPAQPTLKRYDLKIETQRELTFDGYNLWIDNKTKTVKVPVQDPRKNFGIENKL